MMTLSQYEKHALKLIKWHKNKYSNIKISDELIGFVIRYMSVADWKYESSKMASRYAGNEELGRYKWRQIRGIYGIRDYIKRELQRNKNEPLHEYKTSYRELSYSEKTSRRVKFLIQNAGLTDKQRSVINYYLEGLNISGIAERLGINNEQCRNLWETAIKKMKRIAQC